MGVTIIALYCFFLTFILFYSLSQFNLVFIYLFKRNKPPQASGIDQENLPIVTVQLPIYNEKYVILRLIDAVVAFDYPKEKLEIQVLDDSNDETVELVAKRVAELRQNGVWINHITRKHQTEFKAGALKHGMEASSGEFIAIFDADFIPDTNFLQRTLPFFGNERVGVVQTRWGHLNQGFSLLTKLQSYALNAHFTVEQTGRNRNRHFINFNGTAGVWRKSTIYDAGGWEGNTLTEDLDLSYRAQLKGWEFVYLENVESPAELPAEMNSVKSQQYRWAKGAAECTRKNLIKVFKSTGINLRTKAHAFFHLLNSFVWICLVASGMLLVPFLYILNQTTEFDQFINLLSVYQVSFFALFIFYFVANYSVGSRKPKDIFYFVLTYPIFLSISMGLSIHNAIGVVRGYMGHRTAFVRTPKFNIVRNQGGITGNSYVKLEINLTTILEILIFGYFTFGIVLAIRQGDYAALPFLIMMAGGIGGVMLYSVIHYIRAQKTASV